MDTVTAAEFIHRNENVAENSVPSLRPSVDTVRAVFFIRAKNKNSGPRCIYR
jgi:hypothetical protein